MTATAISTPGMGLAEVLEISPAHRRAIDVHPGASMMWTPRAPRIHADHLADPILDGRRPIVAAIDMPAG